MGLLRAAAAIVIAGCSAQPTPPPPLVDCEPTATSSLGLELVAISPSDVPIHGGDVELAFDGAMAQGQPIYVNGVAAQLDGTTLHVPAARAGIGPLSIRVGGDPAHPMAALTCAGHYVDAPDSVALGETPASLAVPLHPELAHDCARVGQVTIANNGDAPFVIYPTLTGSPAFSLDFPPDACPLPMFYDSCQVNMCFSSSVTMTHAAHLEVPSTATTASLDFTATVLPPTPGLEVALWRPYLTPANEKVRGVIALPGGDVAVWDESPATMFETVTPSGLPAWHAMGAVATIDGASIRTLRAGAAGQGMFAIVGNAQQQVAIHFDDTGTRDVAFGELSLGRDTYFATSAIEVAPARAFAIGHATVTAITPTGAIDTAWGAAGVVDFSARGAFTGRSALDATGRLYVVTTTGVTRIVNGAIDPSFGFTGAVTALALANNAPLVATGAGIARLDDAGAATLVAAPQHAVVDLAVDAAGQLAIITDDGSLARYSATGQLAGPIGFDGASRVACPVSGDCAIVGLANGLDRYLIEIAP